MSFQKNVQEVFKHLKKQSNFQNLIHVSILCEHEIMLVPLGVFYKDNYTILNNLLQWRTDPSHTFINSNECTIDSTKIWYQNQLIDNDDRILFLLVDELFTPIGHIGLSLTDEKDTLLITNVIRGVQKKRGAFSIALVKLIQWAYKKLNVKHITVTTLEKNTHAVEFYKKNNFVMRANKIPLKENVEEKRYVPCSINEATTYKVTFDYIFQNFPKAKPAIPSKNILLTSAGGKVELINIVKESKQRIDDNILLYCGDSDFLSVSQYYCDNFWLMPSDAELNIDIVLAYCLQEKIGYIIPTRDAELEFWAKHKELLLHNGIYVMVSSLEQVQNIYDKYNFYNLCKNYCLPTIPSSYNIEEINSTKYVVKETKGAGARNNLINATKKQALDYAKTLTSPIFQPFIKGREYNADIYCDGTGKLHACVLLQKLQIIPPNTASVAVSFKNKKFEDIIHNTVKKLNINGLVQIEFFNTDNGEVYIIEVNLRGGATAVLSYRAGLDAIYWFLLESMGKSLSDYPFIRTEKEIKMLRYIKADCLELEEDLNE